MKKKIVIISAICIFAAGITGVWLHQIRKFEPTDVTALETESEASEITVQINIEPPELPEYKEITDAETGETVIAEVQVNEPIEQKSTTPPQKPKAEGSYTNPEQPPVYTQEQTVAEEQPQTSNKTNQSGKSGQVYVEGFGYVDKAGETKTQTGVSDGDINKMVGSMD